MLAAIAPLALAAALAPSPPEDGKVARLSIGFPAALPEPVQTDITQRVDETLKAAGLEVIPVNKVCGDAECYKAALSEAGVSLGMQVLVTMEGPDYTLTTTFFDASGVVVASDGEPCDICRHDEVVAKTAGLVERASSAFQIEAQAAVVSVVSSPSGATVMIDGQAVGNTPYQADLAEGTHTIRVEQKGYQPMERTVEGTPGARVDEAFSLKRDFPLDPRTEMTIGWASLGVGVAALAAGVALLVIDENEIKSDCSGDNVDANGVCKYRYNTLAGGAVAVAGGVLLTGAGIGLVVHGRKRAGKKTEVTLSPGGLRGRF